MAKYDYNDWERYEEQAYREVIEPKKKPKKQKKSWKDKKQKENHRDKKNSWSNRSKRD
tara:strand:+ start:819 stop:992 length:174 start_codon:yes stop_codon:yes gene_type:complete